MATVRVLPLFTAAGARIENGSMLPAAAAEVYFRKISSSGHMEGSLHGYGRMAVVGRTRGIDGVVRVCAKRH